MASQWPWECVIGQPETWGCAHGQPSTTGTHYYDGDMQGADLPVNQLQRRALVACVGNVHLLGNPLPTQGRTHARARVGVVHIDIREQALCIVWYCLLGGV